VTVIGEIDNTRLVAPGTTHLHLDDGRWMIFEASGTQRGFRASSADITVRGDREALVSVRPVTGRQTINTRGDEYVGILEFTAPRDGDYEIEINYGSDIILGRPITDAVRSVVWWGIGAFFAFGVFVLFLVLAIVPVRAAGAPAIRFQVPPGWYPDPTPGTGLVRWWDGYRWTEHTQRR